MLGVNGWRVSHPSRHAEQVADVIVVSGPPGAGKSSIGAVLVDMFEPSALVEGDSFFGFLRRGFIEPWLPGSNRQNDVVIDAAAAAAGRLAIGGYTVVYDGVIGPWFRARFAANSGLPEWQYVVLLPPEDVCVERVRTRIGHEFGDVAATRHMHREFSRSDIDRRHVIDRVGEPTEIASLIRDGLRSGRFLITRAGPDPITCRHPIRP